MMAAVRGMPAIFFSLPGRSGACSLTGQPPFAAGQAGIRNGHAT